MQPSTMHLSLRVRHAYSPIDAHRMFDFLESNTAFRYTNSELGDNHPALEAGPSQLGLCEDH